MQSLSPFCSHWSLLRLHSLILAKPRGPILLKMVLKKTIGLLFCPSWVLHFHGLMNCLATLFNGGRNREIAAKTIVKKMNLRACIHLIWAPIYCKYRSPPGKLDLLWMAQKAGQNQENCDRDTNSSSHFLIVLEELLPTLLLMSHPL